MRSRANQRRSYIIDKTGVTEATDSNSANTTNTDISTRDGTPNAPSFNTLHTTKLALLSAFSLTILPLLRGAAAGGRKQNGRTAHGEEVKSRKSGRSTFICTFLEVSRYGVFFQQRFEPVQCVFQKIGTQGTGSRSRRFISN